MEYFLQNEEPCLMSDLCLLIGFRAEGALTILGKENHSVSQGCPRLSVCVLCVCPDGFWSAATSKVNGTANRLTRL